MIVLSILRLERLDQSRNLIALPCMVGYILHAELMLSATVVANAIRLAISMMLKHDNHYIQVDLVYLRARLQ